MKFATCLAVGVLSLTMGMLRSAYACWETAARKPVTLPNCVGERAAIVLNRALRDSDPAHPLRIELIDGGHQTNFALHGTRSCEGAVTSTAGIQYTGTWSYTRIDDTMIRVIFSLQPSHKFFQDMRPAAELSVQQEMLKVDP
jgi:hypothetical protein